MDSKVQIAKTEADRPLDLDVDLAALPFDEWLKRFRADFPIGPEIDAEELIRQGEEAAAEEFWERYNLDR